MNSSGYSLGETRNASLLNREEYAVCSDPEYYSGLYGLIGTIFQSSILLVGVAGNLLVVVMVIISRSLHTTTNCYLVSLAIADIITLVFSVPQVRYESEPYTNTYIDLVPRSNYE